MGKRQEFLNLIDKNISKYGYHTTFVNGAQNPNFIYTIGLHKKFGFELVIAGGFISIDNYEQIFDLIVEGINSGLNLNSTYKCNEELGNGFKLLEIHSSWKKMMLLGAYDYYGINDIKAFQIIPIDNRLLDQPLMSESWNKEDSVWCWLQKDWVESTPKDAYVITNIKFLEGKSITEIMRWEDGYWEMFVGDSSDVADKDVRVLPLGVMIGIDDSLRTAIDLINGNGLWRENKESEWQEWK